MLDCNIILTVYNQPEVTLRCLASLAAAWRSCDRLIIVDDGSKQETQSVLKAWCANNPRVTSSLIHLNPNQGFISAANAGLRYRLDKACVCLLNNDTIVSHYWLERMCGLLEREPGLGVLNPMSSTFGLRPAGGESIDELAAALAAKKRGEFTEAASCVGFCMLIRRQVLKAIGYLDPVFADGYFEDTDFCRRAAAAGFGCAICLDAYVWHKEHATFKDNRRQELFDRNKKIFEERWGRPQRQLVSAARGCSAGDAEKVSAWCLASARKGNWLWVIVPAGQRERFSVLQRHGNIKVLETRLPLGLAGWLLRLKRRKKPITRIISSEEICHGQTAL